MIILNFLRPLFIQAHVVQDVRNQATLDDANQSTEGLGTLIIIVIIVLAGVIIYNTYKKK